MSLDNNKDGDVLSYTVDLFLENTSEKRKAFELIRDFCNENYIVENAGLVLGFLKEPCFIQIGYQEHLISANMDLRLKKDLEAFCKHLVNNNIYFDNAKICVPVNGKIYVVSSILYDDIIQILKGD